MSDNNLLAALHAADLDQVKAAWAELDSDWRDPQGRHAIFLSALSGRLSLDIKLEDLHLQKRRAAIFEFLVCAQASGLETRDDFHNTVLMAAAIGGNRLIFDRVWQLCPGQAPKKNQNGESVLMFAAAGANPHIFRCVLERYPEMINDSNIYHSSVLMFALHSKQWPLIELILKHAPTQLQQANDMGTSPIMAAAIAGDLEIFQALMSLYMHQAAERLQDINYKGESLLIHALKGRNEMIIKLVLKHLPNLASLAAKDGLAPHRVAQLLELPESAKLIEAIKNQK